jgi:Holliday junction resolvase RusA-like endonuclease
MNEIIDANRTYWGAGATLKKRADRQVTASFPPFPPQFPGMVDIDILWNDPTRRDPDNIMAGIKFILDAMVNYGILQNDSRKWIGAITHQVVNDRKTTGSIIVTVIDKS